MELPSGDHLGLSMPRSRLRQLVQVAKPRRVAESKSASQICAAPVRLLTNRMRLPSAENSGCRVAGLGDGDLERLATRNRLQPQLRRFGVLCQVDGGHGVGQPFAVRRNGGFAQPLHRHHVLECHGALRLRGGCAVAD